MKTDTQTGFQPFARVDFYPANKNFRNDYMLDEEDPAASAPGIQLDFGVVHADRLLWPHCLFPPARAHTHRSTAGAY